MKEDFKDCLVYASPFIQADRKAITGKPSRGRAEVRWTLYDNQYLSDEDVAAFEEAVLGDPQADARLRGDYVDMSGQCPFDVPILRSKWLPRCRPGDIHKVQVLTETDTNEGRIKTPVWLEYEQWFDWEDEEQYLAVGDPSMGIKPRPDDPPSRRHDPAGLWVVACVNPRLVVRYNGYVAPYGLGRLAALLAKEANRALVDCDNTAGYGSPFYTALNDAKHTNVNRDIDPSKPGQIMKGLGYRISAASRGSMLGFLDQTILDDGLVIPSREAVECFMNVTTDVNDRFASTRGRKGRFDEDLSIACRVAKLLATRKWRARKVHRKDRFTRHKDEARRAAHRPPQPDW
jgi:hypothetical protein